MLLITEKQRFYRTMTFLVTTFLVSQIYDFSWSVTLNTINMPRVIFQILKTVERFHHDAFPFSTDLLVTWIKNRFWKLIKPSEFPASRPDAVSRMTSFCHISLIFFNLKIHFIFVGWGFEKLFPHFLFVVFVFCNNIFSASMLSAWVKMAVASHHCTKIKPEYPEESCKKSECIHESIMLLRLFGSSKYQFWIFASWSCLLPCQQRSCNFFPFFCTKQISDIWGFFFSENE